jgi:hypothetical protein
VCETINPTPLTKHREPRNVKIGNSVEKSTDGYGRLYASRIPSTNIPKKNIPITKTTSIEIKALKRVFVSPFSK